VTVGMRLQRLEKRAAHSRSIDYLENHLQNPNPFADTRQAVEEPEQQFSLW